MEPAARIAVITGAAGGIGAALATEAARRGMMLALADVAAPPLDDVTARLAAAGARVVSARLDTRDPEAVAQWAEEVRGMGEIALVFANAGVLRAGSILEQDPGDINLVIDVNLKGTINTVRAFVPLLTSATEPSRILITGSQASMLAYPGLALYSATKHALWALAETLRDELALAAPHVGVSLLCPGAVSMGMSSGRAPRPGEAQESMTPDRLAEIAFAAADRGAFHIFTHPEVGRSIATRMNAMIEGIR